MARSELFLLLPWLDGKKRKPIYMKDVGQVLLDALIKICEGVEYVATLVRGENYKGYYDNDNFESLVLAVKNCGEDIYLVNNIILRLRRIISKWGEDWRNPIHMKQTSSSQYVYYGVHIQDDTLCEMAERISNSTDESSFLLVDCSAIDYEGGSMLIERDGVSATLDVRNLELMPIAKWFESNRRPERKFGLNPKHGENGRGAHPSYDGEKVSVLMCSKEEAHILLQSAIGTSYERSKPLFFYDTQHKQYIEFRKTTSGDKVEEYHGFHLDAADSERRVPKEIKELIGKILHPSLGR